MVMAVVATLHVAADQILREADNPQMQQLSDSVCNSPYKNS